MSKKKATGVNGFPYCDRADCFARLGTGECNCLRETGFKGRPCPFFKTKADAEAGWAKYGKGDWS